MEKEKTSAEMLAEKLLSQKKSCYKEFAQMVKDTAANYCRQYMDFLDEGKTERECTAAAVKKLEENGFVPFANGKNYKPGDRIYYENRKKSLIAAVIGKKPLENGMNIAAAHIDSPRLDLKPSPIYEADEICYFKTHYYGGIKRYQWATIPLAVHGVVMLKSGEAVELKVGEKDDDPIFCISDILPHLSANVQDSRTSRDVLKGEEMNVILGTKPIDDSSIKDAVKLNIMKLLNESYGLTEDDFMSAEIEIVPAFKARYLGFDKSLIAAYGHDDRICAYTALTALIDCKQPERTALCVLADKEETGSDGNTGMNSCFLSNFITMLSRGQEAMPEAVLMNSFCLSADVNAAFDPNFAEVMDKRNCGYLNYGPVVTKFTGVRGKGSTNDASAETFARTRAILDSHKVPWQSGLLGKVDEGGGGTVAKYISYLGVDVIDIGAPLLSMHAPYEVASVLDIMALNKAFIALYDEE
ncbi:MAG: aminopeptidase [Oscillospiraceae bacterium]